MKPVFLQHGRRLRPWTSSSSTTVGRLSAWHMPGGSVDSPARRASRQMLKEEVEQRRKPMGPELGRKGSTLIHYLHTGVPDCSVTPLLMGPVCLISEGRFEEPVRP